jgi:hypothetical protein
MNVRVHDPLCAASDPDASCEACHEYQAPCSCDLIDTLRAGWYARGQRDERQRIKRRVLTLPVVGRLAGTDSTLSALHVLAVIDGIGEQT